MAYFLHIAVGSSSRQGKFPFFASPAGRGPRGCTLLPQDFAAIFSQPANVDEKTARSAKGVWYNNGASMIPLYLTAKHRANDGGLEFIFEYRLTPNPEHDLDIFFEKMRTALNLGAEDPNIKVSEILEKCAIER